MNMKYIGVEYGICDAGWKNEGTQVNRANDWEKTGDQMKQFWFQQQKRAIN